MFNAVELPFKSPFTSEYPDCPVCLNLGRRPQRSSNSGKHKYQDLKAHCAGCAVICALLAPYTKGSGKDCLFSVALHVAHTKDTRDTIIRNTRLHVDWPGRNKARLELHLFTNAAGTQYSRSPLPVLPHISGNTGSLQAVKWVTKQLATCLHSPDHDEFRPFGPPQLPRRVLCITGSKQVRLLVTSPAIRGPYACLSHCWGSAQLIRTTKDTLDSYQDSIPWDLMPRTFRDAIMFVYSLRIRYIWIDSLCIVQDNVHDWRQEGGKMADIYKNSYITISAASAADSSHGLFRFSHDDHHSRLISFRDSALKIYARRGLDHGTYLTDELPLLTRGWALQELLLSPRVVHFFHNEMLWECNASWSCECTPDDSQLHPTNHIQHLIKRFHNFHNQEFIGHVNWLSRKEKIPRWEWHTLVTTYTTRTLTFERDIFPALQGLAKSFASKTRSPYLAGLWEHSLGYDLLWYACDWEQRRPLIWRAPSWSWASVLGEVRWPTFTQDFRAHATFKAVTEPAEMDPFGELTSGTLRLTALCFETELSRLDRSEGFYHKAFGYVMYRPDSLHDREDEASSSDTKCFALIGLQNNVTNPAFFLLALVPVSNENYTYRRIGMLEIWGEFDSRSIEDRFKGIKEKTCLVI